MMTRNFCILVVAVLLYTHVTAQQPRKYAYPPAVNVTLNKTGSNRLALVKALEHYYAGTDTQKHAAISFLVANMPHHGSADFYWADYTNKRLPYDELSYPNEAAAQKAWSGLSSQYMGVHPVIVSYMDMDTVTTAYLISTVDNAFDSWQRNMSNVSFADFCEYILPYRTSIEPIQNWRSKYINYFDKMVSDANVSGSYAIVRQINRNTSDWFKVTGYNDGRREPLPRLGGIQLMMRKEGPCEDLADLRVLALRSQGIPAAVDLIPFWATSSGSHFVAVALGTDSGNVVLDNINISSRRSAKLIREPGKVLRTTFSPQEEAVASHFPTSAIPIGVLSHPNLKDVTAEYWPVTDVKVPVYKRENLPSVVYACVLNFQAWQPIWWGYRKGKVAVWNNMGKGAVYQPMYYQKGSLKAAGDPIAIGYEHTIVLHPDKLHLQTIKLIEEEKYLKFRPDKRYSLCYWNKKWIALGTQAAKSDTKELIFKNVPKNALFLLRPEYSTGKDRPFIINEQGGREWY